MSSEPVGAPSWRSIAANSLHGLNARSLAPWSRSLRRLSFIEGFARFRPVPNSCLMDVRDRPVWLDHQLYRYADASEVRWAWRRTSVEMTQLYAEMDADLARRRHD